MLDTIVWLLHFPASHGYVMVFIAAFGAAGLGMLAFGGRRGGLSRLQEVRVEQGLAEAPSPSSVPGALDLARRILFRILFAVVLGSGLIGLLALLGVPVTNAYIHANGRVTTGTMDGDWVTFITEDGTEYTLANDFFTPSVHPDAHASVGWAGAPVTVRYLPAHPQAYVIDSSASGGE